MKKFLMFSTGLSIFNTHENVIAKSITGLDESNLQCFG